MPRGALSHVRVVDLTSHVAGPLCTKLLADYGAEVIKVECPGGGDVSRRLGPCPGNKIDPEASARYVYLNGNKKSVTLNLASSDGLALLHELAKGSDLAVIGMRPATLDRLGLDPASLAAINPKLAAVYLSNFGLTGPYRDWAADHLVLCAMGGWAQYLGEKARPPLQAGMQVGLQAAGVQAASAALAVYRQSQSAGEGVSRLAYAHLHPIRGLCASTRSAALRAGKLSTSGGLLSREGHRDAGIRLTEHK